MPAYADPLSAIGGALGGIGGSALGLLGNVLSPLDYPRQALWNAVKGVGNAIGGQGTWEDALGAIPGALGGLAMGGAALSGLGLPAAIAAGSALGGLAQGAGKATGNEAFNAPEVSDLTGTKDFGTNLLVGALTDPLTFAGGLGGASRGSAAGRAAGEGLEAAALARGPRYPGSIADKLSTMIPGGGASEAEAFGDLFGTGAARDRAFGEIPMGSTYLGHGAEATAFKTPQGGVVRVGWDGGGPVQAPQVLQPYRNVLTGDARVTHSPLVETTGSYDPTLEALRSGVTPGLAETEGQQLARQNLRQANKEAFGMQRDWGAAGQELGASLPPGLEEADLHTGNIARTPEGNWLTHDPGAILPKGEGGTFAPTTMARPQDQPGRVTNWLLNMLGSDRSIQNELAQAARRGTVGQGVALPGLAASDPSFLRQLASAGLPDYASMTTPLRRARTALGG